MPRRCTVCTHEDQGAIDRALISGVPYRSIAKRYGASESAVYRHQQEHLPAWLAKVQEARELASAERLAAELEEVKADVRRLKKKAEAEGDYRTALLGCDKALKALELARRIRETEELEARLEALEERT